MSSPPKGPLIVIKVGGDVLLDEAQRTGLAKNVAQLRDDGVVMVIIHGGGPQVTALQEKLGLEAKKVNGRRVTSKADLVVVEQAICGEVNVGLVSTLLEAGVPAFGTHGASAGLFVATRRPPQTVNGDVVDYGEVGDVKSVNGALVRGLCDLGVTPVIGTLGADANGRIYNINADTTAVQLARALQAHMLLLVTAVGGVFKDIKDPASRIPTLTPSSGKALIADGTISGGMIPKVEEALSILDEGVGAVAILGAQHPGAFRSALSGDGALGTRFQR